MALIWFKSMKRRVKVHGYHYLRCLAKTLTFLFWVFLYVAVMRVTLFKSTVNTPVRDWSLEPDNYSKFLMQGEVLGDEEPDEIDAEAMATDNATVAELEERVMSVQQTCQARSLHSQTINNKEFFVDYTHHLIWCNIFKAASSSWLYNFNILGGYKRSFLERSMRLSPLLLARRKFPRPDKEELITALSDPSMTSLLIVREPFVRLLSAFRDKLEIRIPLYYKKLSEEIVAKQRKRAIERLGPIQRKGPTFYEFVAYLIDIHKNSRNATGFDEHWAPYYQFCSPCSANFSVVAKVETLARDSAYVINLLGLGHVLGKKVKNRRMRLRNVINKSKDGKKTVELLKYYYSQLDEEMLEDLLKIYGIDFEMFGYDQSFYRSLVMKNKYFGNNNNNLRL